MADKPQDKKANALARIKALKEGRSAARGGGAGPGSTGKDTDAPKNAPRSASTGHRPQGG